MLENLSSRFAGIVRGLGGGRITEANIAAAMEEARAALLEADVALPVAREFVERAAKNAAGARVQKSVTPGQAFIKILHEELTRALGGDHAPLKIGRPPCFVLACGLQGVGKTTTLGKIAKRLKEKNKKRVMLAGLDIHRPAAMEQLRKNAEAAGAAFFENDEMQSAQKRAAALPAAANRVLADVVLVDTAGRNALDAEMMDEIRGICGALKPAETLFFVDAMQGQHAVNIARAFGEALPLTGLVLTKMDGDARGGAALSARHITGRPIKFVGAGEKPDDLQPFFPARLASRILGMGDVVSLVEKAQETADRKTLAQLTKKISKPSRFDLNDYLSQIQQLKKMGGAGGLLDKLPAAAAQKLQGAALEEKRIRRLEAVILSMTPDERRLPPLIKASRKRRIAAGAGVEVPAVNEVLRQYETMQKMFKRFAKNPAGMARMLQGFMN